jgi:4-hydroxybutyrate CoA-transferase
MGRPEEEYRRRLTTPEEAVRRVRSGQRVIVPIGCNPLLLADALAARAGEIEDVEIDHCAVQADYVWLHTRLPAFRVVHEHFASPSVRAEMLLGQHDYVPVPMSRRFKAADEARTPGEQRRPDVVLLVVAPPDEEGFVNLGNNVWNTKRYVEEASLVLAEVSERVPRCFGDTRLHVTAIDALVESRSPPMATGTTRLTAERRAIAEHVASLIRDGDTLQIGVGKASTAIAFAGVLDERVDLGWHSEASPGAIVDLVRRGVITGRRKALHPGKAVATSFAVRDEDLPYIDGNPAFELHSCDHVHDPRTIASIDNLVAINSAVAIDLSGQVSSESIGDRTITGTGGQLEFAIGACWSRGGRSITVLPSTALLRGDGGVGDAGDDDGPSVGRRPVSRIVPRLPAGAAVTVPRLLTDIVVTEQGIARLLGKSLRERAAELIAVAHPDFRADLRRAASRLFGE